jgi:23S rRNA-/tRNA-specific pseudouridylate synthase
MAIKKTLISIPKEMDGERLDNALARLLPEATGMELSKGKIRKLIVAGAIYMNNGRVRIASKTVRGGMRIEAYIDPNKLFSESEARERGGAAPGGTRGGMNLGAGPSALSRRKAWAFEKSWITFEDEWIIGVNKPPGLPTQPTLDEARANLYALLQKFLRERDGEKAYVGLHHRLDRDTSGVMIFTRDKRANGGVGKLFQEHLAQKTYLAIVRIEGNADAKTGAKAASVTGLISAKGSQGVGTSAVGASVAGLPDEWVEENFLARDKGKAGKMRSVRSGGDKAITDFRVLERVGNYALVEARPRTGRMHQIRVHLSERGAPIIGDRTYGGATQLSDQVPRVMLHARALDFPHPISGEPTRVEAEIPEDFRDWVKRLFLVANQEY